MEIIKFPNPHLLKPTKEVKIFSKELLTLLESMYEIMQNNYGIGLAANQVGLDYSMFVMEGPGKEKYFIVNPVIVNRSTNFVNFKEGCLSAPGEFLRLNRASWVDIDYQDETGQKKSKKFWDIHSVCVQHEIDHLEGKSFLEFESIPKKIRKSLAKKWNLK